MEAGFALVLTGYRANPGPKTVLVSAKKGSFPFMIMVLKRIGDNIGPEQTCSSSSERF